MFSRGVLKNNLLLPWLVRAVDLVIYITTCLIAFYIQFNYLALFSRYQVAILLSVLLIIPIFSRVGVYQSLRGRSLWACLKPLYLGLSILMIILASIAFITKTGDHYSRAWFLIWHGLALLLFTASRIALYWLLHLMRQRGWNHKRIVIIGSGELVRELVQRVQNALWSGFDVAAIFDETAAPVTIGDLTVQQMPADLHEYISREKIDEVWLALTLWEQAAVQKLMSSLHHDIVTIRYFPNILGVDLLNHSVAEVLGLPVINVISSPITEINWLGKLVEDYFLSILIVVGISPLLLVIAILVKLSSSGPIFYRQKRVGWNGKEFAMLKFRSMPVNAEAATGAVWAKAEDQRATKIGAFLRKTSLDELPQFFNVLRGEMSIVGPRPERPEFVSKFKYEVSDYMKKHLVKAGITGWAQVNGWRGNTSLEKRIEYDLYYINHWSLWFDLKIIWLTVFKGFVNKNAY